MASGHVNRAKRPNTWLHRPMLQNVKKALANSEPSTHGTKQTCGGGRLMSVSGGRPEVARMRAEVSVCPKRNRRTFFYGGNRIRLTNCVNRGSERSPFQRGSRRNQTSQFD